MWIFDKKPEWNTGKENTWSFNSWDRNSWDRNSWDRNSWYLNSDKPTVRIFNKDTGISRDDFDLNQFPSFFYFDYLPTEWISETDMTEEEKKSNPLYNIAWWYLKKNIPNTASEESKKEWIQKAWRASRDKASEEDRNKIYALPNWDNEIFKEISWIDVDKELNNKELNLTGEQVEVTIKWKTYKAIIQ